MSDQIEVVVSFDTTGSMYPCLTQVRREVEALMTRLFKEIPNLAFGVIAHGDYCDAGSTYVTKRHEISRDQASLARFIRNVEPTGGGDSPECYELVLHEARAMNWTQGKSRVLIMIGDDVPHGPHESQNYKKLDWRNELAMLAEMRVNVYGVQALGRRHATKFYEELATITGGFKLDLNQFADAVHLITAIAMKQQSAEALSSFESELQKRGAMNRTLAGNFAKLTGKSPSTVESKFATRDLEAVPPWRFQVLDVKEGAQIRKFVTDNGLDFKPGRGFYEFTKREEIQGYKEIVLMERSSGDMFTGRRAREILGLPEGATITISPAKLDKYRVFVQSTSYNRKLVPGTGFLYEVNDHDR